MNQNIYKINVNLINERLKNAGNNEKMVVNKFLLYNSDEENLRIRTLDSQGEYKSEKLFRGEDAKNLILALLIFTENMQVYWKS